MSSAVYCSTLPLNTRDDIMHLLGDKGGVKYYEQMRSLPVETATLKANLDKACASRIRTWLDMCAHCGMCAQSCFLYTANDNVPEQIPSHKIQSTLGVMLKNPDKVTTEFMIQCMEVAWSRCTCCNRCAVYCPYGIDTGVMISTLRGILFKHGFVPWELKIGSGMHRVFGAQMDVTEEDWLETCEWMMDEQQEEWPGVAIPVDKPNADVMYVLNAREVKHYPEDLAEAAILFHIAGTNWTVPSAGWENTSLSLFAGDWEGCTQNVKRVYDAVERLKPKIVVGTECGHAHRATVIEGPYWAGREDGTTPTQFMHYVEWMAMSLRTGAIKIDPAKRIKVPCTLQDSCNYVRNHGLGKYTREIMGYIAEDFREMNISGDHNYCCGGGGGFNGIGMYRKQRNIALKPKLDQILATGAEIVISPCHNCWDAIRDMIEEFEVHQLKWSFLKPLIMKMLIVPDHIERITE